MSEATEKALEVAREHLRTAQGNSEAKKRVTLAYIAAHLPGKAESIAKRYAHEQPEVTKSIGREGVSTLRAEVAEEARVLGAAFIAAVDDIEWPISDGTYSKVSPGKIHSAIFKRFHGKVDGVIGPIRSAGYTLDARHTNSVILPQYLYEEDWFDDLAQALNDLSTARRTVQAARAADDKSAVDDLWI
ncbi:hypothetical protein [Cryobacterium sp. TMT3-29-2]|uniref:hypothetical protein n=1 Tax=Cryobacterium sp. TMT3-29-2 TaxID=2555867 RepID=UPI0010743E6D|nr:hypothetical protein [Cryobacterium sp. TMT3-29-2]TFC83038.1 hypothetical protein E3O67_15430 [Cryobacterium sp. TMT3-29-2]